MILYQRTNDGITLVIDRDSAVEIADWDRTVEPIEQGGNLHHGSSAGLSVASRRGWTGGDLLNGSGRGPYELSFKIYANSSNVILTVELPVLKYPVSKNQLSYRHNVRSCFSFKGREASNLSSRLSTWCPNDLRSAQEVVLTIRGDAYRSLREWEHWTDKEVFTGTYTYYFSDNGEWDNKRVLNDRTSESWKHSNLWSEQE